IGVPRLRNTTFTLTVAPPGMFGDGKYFASGCAWPSIVKPVTSEPTPASSRRVSVVCQLNPCASGWPGQTVFAAVTVIADAPGATVTVRVRTPPPLLKAASPEYVAVTTFAPVLSRYAGKVMSAACPCPARATRAAEPSGRP